MENLNANTNLKITENNLQINANASKNNLFSACGSKKEKNENCYFQTTIDKLKKGDFFRLKENGKLLVRGDYNRSINKYEFSYYDDISHFGEKKKGTKVYVD